MLHVGLRIFICLNFIIGAAGIAGERIDTRKPASLGSYGAKLRVNALSLDVNPELFRKEIPTQAKAEQDARSFAVKPIEHGSHWGGGSIPAYY